MTVEQEARTAPAAPPASDGVEAAGLDLLEEGVEAEALHRVDHEAGQRALARRAGIALEADHLREKLQAVLRVDGLQQLGVTHRVSSPGDRDALSQARRQLGKSSHDIISALRAPALPALPFPRRGSGRAPSRPPSHLPR